MVSTKAILQRISVAAVLAAAALWTHRWLRKTLLVSRQNVRRVMARTERAIAPWERKWGCEILPRPKYRK